MRALARETMAWSDAGYDRAWLAAARSGIPAVAIDARARGWRYLSLNALVLTAQEASELKRLTNLFTPLLDWATRGILEDSAWWPHLAWPWPAIELAAHEPLHPAGRVTLYGRFDWLLDHAGQWQLVEYNADTPSGGREVAGLEPAVFRLHGGRRAGLRRLVSNLDVRLASAMVGRIRSFEHEVGRPVRLVGVVSSHDWIEDMAQAWWLTGLLNARGVPTLAGDVRDLAVIRDAVLLRGRPIDALYRFYPIERLYRHGVFAPLLDAVTRRRLLLLNGLRGFLAQSKAVLAWLWDHRADPCLTRTQRAAIQAHLPAILPARWPEASALLPNAVVKHVNGREGDTVRFGEELDTAAWEERLLEGGYMVQRRVRPLAVEDISVEETSGQVSVVGPRYPCVGAFSIGGRFGGCYTRLGGLVTTADGAFAPTFRQAPQRAAREA